MKIQATAVPGVLLLTPAVWCDSRGSFLESWQMDRYADAGLPERWMQDNISVSARDVLRGLHFQYPLPQGKLISVLAGSILDIAVDVRHGSPSFGHSVVCELTEANHQQLYVPEGFAHGFLVTSDEAIVHYKCTEYYQPASDHTLAWNDPALELAWPVRAPIVSAKDALGKKLADFGAHELPTFVNRGG